MPFTLADPLSDSPVRGLLADSVGRKDRVSVAPMYLDQTRFDVPATKS